MFTQQALAPKTALSFWSFTMVLCLFCLIKFSRILHCLLFLAFFFKLFLSAELFRNPRYNCFFGMTITFGSVIQWLSPNNDGFSECLLGKCYISIIDNDCACVIWTVRCDTCNLYCISNDLWRLEIILSLISLYTCVFI